MHEPQIKLSPGIRCKACDQDVSEMDPELCYECLAVVYDLCRDITETEHETGPEIEWWEESNEAE